MPDSRTIRLCRQVSPGGRPRTCSGVAGSLIGGGYPIVIDVQQRQRSPASVSGHRQSHDLRADQPPVQATGEQVYSIVRGQRVPIGRASDKQLTRLPFSEVYPDFAARRTYLNLDIGLIEIDDVNDWTSQIYGLGEIGQLADLSEQNISLRLIGADVVAHGARPASSTAGSRRCSTATSPWAVTITFRIS
jgi:hypothetical protein